MYQKLGFGIAAEQTIYAKFDRTLFSDDFASFEFYQNEIQATFEQLEQLNQQTEQWEFLTAKLLAQCTALSEAMNRQQFPSKSAQKPTKSAVVSQRKLSKSEQVKHEIHKLPPRERLSKYYEALSALNNKITHQENLLLTATTQDEKKFYHQQITITQQRKNRCLEAIELLEEYLAFKDEKDM
ncbi:restart primosome assembly protein PriC [Cricetibacter osteomyelitidis]|uniref:Restart primosome assembly protein PriC n=2 Tax=Cricetibacter osteomyelitidis TaxID=1521931 RepID=A0A4R2T3X6_9PAST|nr:restart primosome assembly protein PriC [Cricetibacter osteomyelitidis]